MLPGTDGTDGAPAHGGWERAMVDPCAWCGARPLYVEVRRRMGEIEVRLCDNAGVSTAHWLSLVHWLIGRDGEDRYWICEDCYRRHPPEKLRELLGLRELADTCRN